MANVYALLSDKGGTGRSVVGGNLAYRVAAGVGDRRGRPTAYVDLDLGSPTAGSVFWIAGAETGVIQSGVHDWLRSGVPGAGDQDAGVNDIQQLSLINVWRRSSRLPNDPTGEGAPLLLVPGRRGGADIGGANVGHFSDRIRALLESLVDEYSVEEIFLDMRAGRSFVSDGVARLLAPLEAPQNSLRLKWLVFHRWTPQAARAAANLISGPSGLKQYVESVAGRPDAFSFRVVRTAVPNPNEWAAAPSEAAPDDGPRLQNLGALVGEVHELVTKIVAESDGLEAVLGMVPWDPLLQWREQLVLDEDVERGLARPATVGALNALTTRLLGWADG